MKVMMIGLSSAGKTSYMGAMYRRFCGEGLGGFSIKATQQADDLSLKRIGDDLAKGKYPSGTDVRALYRFNLCYQNQSILDFDWTDYRGGLLVDFDCSIREMEKWEQELASADAVIIFLDSTKMTVNSDGGNYNGFSQMEALNDLIQKVATSHTQDRFPISLVLTKIDMLNDSLGGSEWEQFNEIQATIAKSKNIHGMITGTVVGKSCLNIEYPFLMSMVFGLQNKVSGIMKEYSESVKEYNEIVALHNRNVENTSIWDDIGSFFSGEPSYRGLAVLSMQTCQERMVRLEKIKSQFEKLNEPLSLLANVLVEAKKDDDCFVELF